MNNGPLLVCDIIGMIEKHAHELAAHSQDGAKLFDGILRCKHLAKVIKARRVPSWPCPPTPDLPNKVVADELVDCYSRTSERVYRVLHLPSFKRDYEVCWVRDKEPDKTFLVLLKLVLAIGATTYCDYFSLRASAIRWVYEAECWLADPSLKHRLGVQYLQIHLLLLIARDMVGVGEDLVWISAGHLFRSAVHLGLHKEPSNLPSRTTLANEMHRRLWNTILELCLQSSLYAGESPLFSLKDFDTLPPSNFDDEQLTSLDAVPKHDHEVSEISFAIALRKMLPARLAVTKFLNKLGASLTYEETLRLDAEIRTSYKSAFQSLEVGSLSEFEVRIGEIIISRYLGALHMPFFTAGLKDSAYAYSRKVAVDVSLKSWYAASHSSDMETVQSSDTTASTQKTDIARITTCGSGLFRNAIMHALLIIGIGMSS
jgi:hypothetical protein